MSGDNYKYDITPATSDSNKTVCDGNCQLCIDSSKININDRSRTWTQFTVLLFRHETILSRDRRGRRF